MNKRTITKYNVMIKAYAIGRSYEKAYELFEVSYSVTLDKCTYTTLSSTSYNLASSDMPHKAISYLEKMRET